MTTPAAYRVDSFYINVGAGDSSIHLLLQTAGDLPTPPGGAADIAKPFVLSAVLIDGGHNRSYTWERIEPAINKIQSLNYTIPGTILKFNSVVMTHWDQDHYSGLLKLLDQKINAQLKNGIDPENVQIDFLKYDLTTKFPLTVFLAPYWKPHDKANGAPKKMQLKVETDAIEYVTYPVPILGTKKSKAVPFFIAQYKDVRGWEVFGPTKPQVTAVNITTPGQLFSLAHPSLQRPGMFVVGSNRFVVGTDTSPVTAVSSLGGRVDVIDILPTPTNQCSIASMIIWPSGRMSAFFAGDLDYKDEAAIVAWTRADGKTIKVPTVKASHHGASTSTPGTTLKNFKPKNYILSAGVSHGHPRES